MPHSWHFRERIACDVRGVGAPSGDGSVGGSPAGTAPLTRPMASSGVGFDRAFRAGAWAPATTGADAVFPAGVPATERRKASSSNAPDSETADRSSVVPGVDGSAAGDSSDAFDGCPSGSVSASDATPAPLTRGAPAGSGSSTATGSSGATSATSASAVSPDAAVASPRSVSTARMAACSSEGRAGASVPETLRSRPFRSESSRSVASNCARRSAIAASSLACAVFHSLSEYSPTIARSSASARSSVRCVT